MDHITFIASLTRPRIKYHRGDSCTKGRTRTTNRIVGTEEATYSTRHERKR
uniref:Uncharacterized protein n=1 Tax=Rhizophora mucronata TaxID=61149 RepID=A0A2P2QGR7_RHIMU